MAGENSARELGEERYGDDKAEIGDNESSNREGTVGAFSFGRGVGLLEGILAANFIPTTQITPAVWKKAMQCPGDKDQARARASDVLPRHAGKWPLKKHDGRAEAALLAVHGARQLAMRTLTAA